MGHQARSTNPASKNGSLYFLKMDLAVPINRSEVNQNSCILTILFKSCTFASVKQLVLISLLCLGNYAAGQKPVVLKSKFFGTYKGDIASFQLDSGKELVDVDSSTIQVTIADSTIEMNIGKNVLKGKYTVMFEAKTYYLLDCKIEGQLAGERIVVYKKGKKISRDGLYPQPSATLYRSKD